VACTRSRAQALLEGMQADSEFPLSHSSNLLCFFKCVCHLEDAETLSTLLLLDSFGVHTVRDLEQALLLSKPTLTQCFASTGLSEESIHHIVSCCEALTKSQLTVKVFTRGVPMSPVGLDCIDTPSSRLVSPIPQPSSCPEK